jgi:transposase
MKVEEAMIIEDLDPKHSLRCKLSSERAEELGLWVVQYWPPSSPDLNPIENVWSLLKKNVSKRLPKSMEELERFA